MDNGKILEYIVNLGLDIAKNHVKFKLDEYKLKIVLQEYIEREKKYNEICTMAEECDFQVLIEYISNNLLSDIEKSLFTVNKKERDDIYNQIISSAISHSKAISDESKKRVERIISNCLDIIYCFFKKEVSILDFLVAAEIVDAVNENTNNCIESVRKELKNETDKISKRVSLLQNDCSYASENISRMMNSGNITEAEKNLNKMFEIIATNHPLYPDYGFFLEDGKLKSSPRTDTAKKKYPPKVSFKGRIEVDSQNFNKSSLNPFDYAYNHQLTLKISINEAVKLLGNRPDPIQYEAKVLEGKEIIYIPPEFPKAFPCSIKVGNKIYFNYILLRTQEILDDGTYIISNSEQKGINIYVELKINPENPEKENYKINISNATNSEYLNYDKFMYELLYIKDLHIYMLDTQKDFLVGNINKVSLKTGFPSLTDEIDFLERVCLIEDHFHIQMKISENINEKEFSYIYAISELIKMKEIQLTWEKVSYRGTVGYITSAQIDKSSGLITNLFFSIEQDIHLFEANFKFSYTVMYRNAKIENYDKFIKLTQLLEDDESIHVDLISKNDKTVIYSLK